MTDLERFDRAMYKYLATISEKVLYSTTSKAIQTITKKSTYKDAIPYNFISFYRDPNLEIDDTRYQFSAAQFGDMVRLSSENGERTARYVHNFPVNLTYQIDIWAVKEVYVQETAIALLHKIYTNESILIADMNPDGEDARFHFTNVNWVDNSDLEVENEKGRLYRHTITVTIEARIKLTRDVRTTEFCVVPVDIYNTEGE